MALRGAPITDQEYVETFGLDPATVNTPALNEAMLDQQYKENVEHYLGTMPQEEADKKANMKRSKAAADIKRLLAMNGMLK